MPKKFLASESKPHQISFFDPPTPAATRTPTASESLATLGLAGMLDPESTPDHRIFDKAALGDPELTRLAKIVAAHDLTQSVEAGRDTWIEFRDHQYAANSLGLHIYPVREPDGRMRTAMAAGKLVDPSTPPNPHAQSPDGANGPKFQPITVIRQIVDHDEHDPAKAQAAQTVAGLGWVRMDRWARAVQKPDRDLAPAHSR